MAKSRLNVRRRVSITFDEPSRTKQSFADECDINKMVARFMKTGAFDNVNERQPFYGDVSEFTSFQQCAEIVSNANQLFQSMPGAIRQRFNDDPGQLIKFLEEPSNRDEAISLGMVNPSQPPIEDKVIAPK